MNPRTIKNIILPLARDQTLDKRYLPLLEYADSQNICITFVAVIEDLDKHQFKLPKTVSYVDLINSTEAAEEKRLGTMITEVRNLYSDISIEREIVFGKPFIEINKLAIEKPNSIIVIDANRGYKKVATQLGSTTRSLMRKSNVPIYAISKNSGNFIKKIAVAIDIDTNEDSKIQLNKSIMNMAADFAKLRKANIDFLHAWQLYGEGYLKGWAHYNDLDLAVLSKQEKNHCHKQALDIIEPFVTSGVNIKAHILEGQAEAVIPDFIDKNGVDLLIMGSVCRTGIPGYFIGNTAESILDNLSCSVITLKPNSFSSPI